MRLLEIIIFLRKILTGDCANIEMDLSLEFSIEDLKWLHQNGVVSQYKRYETWLEDFCKKLPSFSVNEGESGGVLQFTFIAHRDGWVRYQDGEHKIIPVSRRCFRRSTIWMRSVI